MSTPINPKEQFDKTNPPKTTQEQANKNVSMLAYLYDNTASDLYNAIRSQNILLTDSKIKDKVVWLGEIAKTLSLVYQLESMRAKPKENSLALPGENIATVDPALQKAQSKQNHNPNMNRPQNLSQFPSPGGWTPF